MKISMQRKKTKETIIQIHKIEQILWLTHVIQIKDSLIKGLKRYAANQNKKWSKKTFYYLIKLNMLSSNYRIVKKRGRKRSKGLGMRFII